MIQDILQQPYDRSKWTGLLTELFPHVSILREPQKLEEAGIDFVKNAYQLGNVRLEDGKNLAIFEVCVNDKIELTRNRVALRNLIAKRIDLGTTHGVLCVFNSSDPEYRFTFVCKETTMDDSGRIETTETNPKRFTYILGPGETRRTAAQRFLELQAHRDNAGIREIVEAFSVERLNKEFFDKYKEHYQAFVDYLIEQTDVPAKIFGVTVDAKSDGYDQACKPVRDWVKKLLGRIVFIYFIQKKGWMGCKPSSKAWKDGDPEFLKNFYASAKDKAHFYSKHLAPLFFEALNTPDREGDIFDLTGTKVPYLNGGLFDEAEEKTRRIDFPEHLFKNLLEFFSSYNFTIDENDPEEHEVGIDPEMLGHIFENLLEENKDKGAYYTPKPVVQFMCQQSLLMYLKTHLGDQGGLETLVRQKDHGDNSKGNWIRQNASRIEELLDKVTICDPAIGSGAFPMGMLQEIFWIKLALDWTLNDPARFAEIKRRIIEHTIHGVDLDAGAVEIARLRCWLSLVVDEVEPRPLPNLEFKIHCANSLIEYMRGEPVDFLKHATLDPSAQKHIRGLESAKTALFEASRKPEKRAARLAIYQAIIELGMLEFTWIRNQEGLYDSGDRAVELNKVLKEYNLFSKQLATAEKLLAKEQDELLSKIQKWHQDQDKPTFAWRIHFAEVFKKGGFDILIANPPYISSKATSNKDALKNRYKSYDQSGDIYVCFYELAVLLANLTGVISYISSNQFFRADYGLKIRELLKKNTEIESIIDVSTAPVFEAAAYPAILHFSKNKIDRKAVNVLSWEELSNPPFSQFATRAKAQKTEVISKKINQSRWLPINEDKIDLVNYLMDGFPILSSIPEYELRRGVVTGRDKAFLINDQIKSDILKSDKKSADIIKPILIGRELSRWSHEQVAKYIIFTRRGVDIESYQGVKSWLSLQRNSLEPGIRGGRKAGPYKWYEVQDSTAYAHLFEKPKIAWGNLARSPKFCWVDAGIYLNAPSPFLVGGDLSLLAILNSPVIHFLVHYTAAVRSGGYREYKNVYIERMPIPILSNKLKNRMIDLAQKAIKNASPSEDEYLKVSSEVFNLSVKQTHVISQFMDNWRGISCE